MLRRRNISSFLGLGYLPMLLICGHDPHPIAGKPVHVPHAPPGTPPIYTPKPKYPLAAREKHQEGVGLLELQLAPDRRVQHVKVLQSTGHSLLDENVVQALRKWKFTPDSPDRVRIPVTYSLHCVD